MIVKDTPFPMQTLEYASSDGEPPLPKADLVFSKDTSYWCYSSSNTRCTVVGRNFQKLPTGAG